MYCVRVFVFIFFIIFTAAATCSLLFPLFRKEASGNKYAIYYWYREYSYKVNVSNDLVHVYTKAYSRDITCTKTKNFYLASASLAVAGAAFGGIGTLFSFAFLFIRRSCCTAVVLVIFSFLAFACFTANTGMITSSYTIHGCADSSNATLEGLVDYRSVKSQNYKIVEAFGLTVAAAGGFLITFIMSFCA